MPHRRGNRGAEGDGTSQRSWSPDPGKVVGGPRPALPGLCAGARGQPGSLPYSLPPASAPLTPSGPGPRQTLKRPPGAAALRTEVRHKSRLCLLRLGLPSDPSAPSPWRSVTPGPTWLPGLGPWPGAGRPVCIHPPGAWKLSCWGAMQNLWLDCPRATWPGSSARKDEGSGSWPAAGSGTGGLTWHRGEARAGRGAVAAPACLWDPARAGTRARCVAGGGAGPVPGLRQDPDPPARDAA